MSPQQTNQAIIADLLNWEEEEHDILPMTPEQIAALEAAGYIIDLRNGAVFRDPDAPTCAQAPKPTMEDFTMSNRKSANVTNDLLTWAAEEQKPLPFNANTIALLEEQGYIVDLETGEVTRDPDASEPEEPVARRLGLPYAGVVYAD